MAGPSKPKMPCAERFTRGCGSVLKTCVDDEIAAFLCNEHVIAANREQRKQEARERAAKSKINRITLPYVSIQHKPFPLD